LEAFKKTQNSEKKGTPPPLRIVCIIEVDLANRKSPLIPKSLGHENILGIDKS
jgi:hypothetical protein